MSKPQIFCYTFAGGTASFFDPIEKDLPALELVKPDYAGHGIRRKEPFYRDYSELADDLHSRFRAEYSGGKYALFGYSMGAITAAEILKRILADPEFPIPVHIYLAAHEPHTKAELAGYAPEEADERVKERTIRFGGVPEKLLENKSFWRTYLPLYKADYSLIGKYRFEDLHFQTEIPATVFYSETDTPRADLEAWRRYFIGKCEFSEFPGNHFFIQEKHQEMARIIAAGME